MVIGPDSGKLGMTEILLIVTLNNQFTTITHWFKPNLIFEDV